MFGVASVKEDEKLARTSKAAFNDGGARACFQGHMKKLGLLEYVSSPEG